MLYTMKGFLKGNDGIFQLAPKVTTIGRDGCDLIIQNNSVDLQHAVVEYSENEDCFVLQDLNSAQGTYVNECRVQNAAVRLAPGDIIRFGSGGPTYELTVDTGSSGHCGQLSYPPVHQRAAWTRPLTVISDPVPPQVVIHEGFPQLRSIVATTTTNWSNQQGRPPPMSATMRSRPLSAGATHTGLQRSQTAQPTMNGQPRSIIGWGSGSNTGRATNNQGAIDIVALQEKEQRILRLQEEIKRLYMYETECQRKDEMIHQLREEIGDLQMKVRRFETSQMSSHTSSSDPEVTQRLLLLENEIHQKRMEVQNLKEQLVKVQELRPSSSPHSRQDINDRVMEINSLKTELERVKKDKNITSGLVTQMQRDMANKDTTISRLTRDMDNIKKEIHDKDVQIQSLRTKWHKSPESRQKDEDLESKEKELAQFRIKQKSLDNRIQEQVDLITSLKQEVEKLGRGMTESSQAEKKMQTDLDQTKVKFQDMERAERLVRVDLEQSSKRMERFRSRVLQTTYSTPGIKAPDKEISDDELLEALKKLIDERTGIQGELNELRESLGSTNKHQKDISDSSKKLKQQINETTARLKQNGLLCSRLKQEIDLVQVVSCNESIVWIKEAFKDLLQQQMEWESSIEKALAECQINVKISDQSPDSHIRHLRQCHVELKQERDELRSRLDEVGGQHQKDLESALETLSLEMEEKAKDEIERFKLENEEKLNRAIDEVRALEEERRETALEDQSSKIRELEANIVQLKSSIIENENVAGENKEATRLAFEECESYKIQVETLTAEVERKSKIIEESNAMVAKEVDKTRSEQLGEISSYKEQIRQHSVTICAMEERLNKVMKKNKDYQSEVTTLKQGVAELRTQLTTRPIPPPKPKVIVQKPAQDVVAMEQLIHTLRLENADVHRQMQEQQDVIMGLRRDLAGASARLTDMTGELSEAQKEEIERHKQLAKQQDMELTECRQQLAKLSQIVDKQSVEIKELNNDLGKQRTSLNKYKNLVNQKESKLNTLESELGREQDANKKSLTLIEEEGRITSELTALGAQCRGDRHEQVILRQRDALTELRSRVKALEQTNPPVPTKDQALQQVVLLKKELVELRAAQNTAQEAQTALASMDGSVLSQQVNRARGIDHQSRAESEIERSAHRETMESLELSENSYLMLLRSIAGALELDDVAGLRSMAHIPRDERQRLAGDRDNACELVSSRIRVLRERIGRKDELLQGYERDLAKLRQAEQLAEHKHVQVESLSHDVRSRTEEAQYLRESLQRTKDRLDQEKRLNTNIKTKKTFHLENEGIQRNGSWPKHHCPPEDIMGKKAAVKKASKEKLKKKDYEIRTLKTELSSREKDLQDSRRRMITMETTSSCEFNSRRDPFMPPEIDSRRDPFMPPEIEQY